MSYSSRTVVILLAANFQRIYSPPGLSPDEVQQFELTLGQRCSDMLLETGPIIIGAVYD